MLNLDKQEIAEFVKRMLNSKTVNSAGTHNTCKTSNINYSIVNGKFVYVCLRCQEVIRYEEAIK